MLHDFLLKYEKEILASTEKKTLELAGVRPSSAQLKQGLPIFYQQLMVVLRQEAANPRFEASRDASAMAKAAGEENEPALAAASAHPNESQLASQAGVHGKELLRLGYTLSHVVHAYGSMCQAITELAGEKRVAITAEEFHDLNRCLDLAIAGAVTAYQTLRNSQVSNKEVEHLGFLAHELRNATGTVTMALELIKGGTVGFGGSTGQVLDRGLKRIEELIDRSLTEVRLRVDPKVHPESLNLLLMVDQIIVTAEIDARARNQTLDIQVHSDLEVVADRQLTYSALSNLIQNALKYTRVGGKIQVRASIVGENVLIEVEDECGGLTDKTVNLFKPFEQQNANRKGLGLGLTIAQRAVELNHGTLEVRNLPRKGCIFQIALPNKECNSRRTIESKIALSKNSETSLLNRNI